MKVSSAGFGLAIGLFAFVSMLPAQVLAQAGTAGARASPTDAAAGKAATAGGGAAAAATSLDMRLWSFGDCTKNFPYVESPEHKECIRVVGSDEAKDARAIYYCSISHGKDPAEATRCKEAYFANKAEAEQEGFRARQADPSAAAAPAAAPPAPKRDKDAEIAALTRALKALDQEESTPAAAAPPEPAPAPAPPPSSVSASNILLGLGIILLLAALGMRYLRRLTDAEADAGVPTRSGRSRGPGTVSGRSGRQY